MDEFKPRDLNPLIEEDGLDTLGMCINEVENLGNTLGEDQAEVAIFFHLMWIKGALRYAMHQLHPEPTNAEK